MMQDFIDEAATRMKSNFPIPEPELIEKTKVRPTRQHHASWIRNNLSPRFDLVGSWVNLGSGLGSITYTDYLQTNVTRIWILDV